MRWEDERYVRVYTRDTAEWLALGWEGQALAMMLLRKCDRAGIVHIGKAGVRGLAALVGVPLDVVERTLPLLLEDGMLQATAGGYVFPNFIAAQETRSSDAQRKRDQRERDRDQAVAGGIMGNKSGLDIQATMSRQAVTPGGHHMASPIESQPDVTSGHQQASPAVTSSHAGTVTPCCAVPSRAVPTSFAGSEHRPPVSHTSTQANAPGRPESTATPAETPTQQLVRELDGVALTSGLLACGPVEDLPDATAHAELEPNPPEKPESSREELRLSSPGGEKRAPARKAARKASTQAEEQPADPRHHPLRAALLDAYHEATGSHYAFTGRSGKTISLLLLQADSAPDTRGERAHAAVLQRWRWGLGWRKFGGGQPVQTLEDLLSAWNKLPRKPPDPDEARRNPNAPTPGAGDFDWTNAATGREVPDDA